MTGLTLTILIVALTIIGAMGIWIYINIHTIKAQRMEYGRLQNLRKECERVQSKINHIKREWMRENESHILITPDYKLGDMVYYTLNGKIRAGIIIESSSSANRRFNDKGSVCTYCNTSYEVKDRNNKYNYHLDSNQLHPTQDHLVKSMIDYPYLSTSMSPDEFSKKLHK